MDPCDKAHTDEIRAYLDTLTAAPAFAASVRKARLLRYLVERKLAGEGDKINEYAMGLDVFDRPASFDPRIESVVRNEVSRLRQRLKEYYSADGQADRIVIELPLRSYAASITFREAVPTPVEAPPEEGAVPAKPRREWRTAAIVQGIALALVVALAGALAIGRIKIPPKDLVNSMVVLPFENLSPNHADEYLADGLTAELTNELGQWKDLRVVARTSAFEFKGKGMDVREVGRRLNVEAALEGSLAKQGDRVRIMAQLYRTANGYRLWSQSFEAKPEDVMAVEQQITRSITATIRNLGGNVPDHVTRAPTTNPEAMDLYLQASYQYAQLTPESLKTSLVLFHQATEKDPSFARAYLGIAAAELESSFLTSRPPEEGVERVRAALQRVLDADPNSGDAHGLLAEIAVGYDWNWPLAEGEFQLALAKGAEVSLRAVYGWNLAARGRFSEGQNQCRAAEGSDPLGVAPRFCQFWVYYFQRDYSEAKNTLVRTLEIKPDLIYAHELLGWIAALEHDCEETTSQFQWIAQKHPMPVAKIGLAFASACRGDRERARQYLKEAAGSTADVSPYQLASGYAFLHDRAAAMSYLQKSAASHESQILWLKYDPVFEEMRSDRRYIAIEKMVGLQP